MYRCPHCNKPGITVLRKALLSPGMPATCKSCGKLIGISYRDWIKAALPGTVVMIAAFFLDSQLLMYGLSSIGLALMILLHLQMVPLIAKQEDPRTISRE